MTQAKPYPDIDASPDFAAIELQIIENWKKNGSFERSVEARPAQKSGANNEYVFYDGPPFANGLPHHGHLLTGFVKDLFARYHTLKGERVERRFGWDCHGLPAEMEAEKGLNISGRKNIMEYGIGNFNDYCRTSVMRYAGEWEWYVNRQARWVDFKNDYKTMDTPFMESVIWAFSELYKKGYIYEGFKVMPYSWSAETVLSASEIRLDDATREKEDKAITVAFKLKDKFKGAPEADGYYILAWTTTPWTLPSNLALAVNREMAYAYHIQDNKCYIATPTALDRIFGTEYTKAQASTEKAAEWATNHVNAELKLIGQEYEPLFPYFKDTAGAFKILAGDFIEEGSGTGVVHMAPGFGEDDYRVCSEAGIPTIVPVDGEGRFTDAVFDITKENYPDLPPLKLKGLNVIKETKLSEDYDPYKPEQLEKYGLANLRIIRWLKDRADKRLIQEDKYLHNYPHCWRTDQPIIYKAMSSWFVDVPQFRDRMVELNQQVNWIPGHIRDGRFGKWIENAREWSISRSRFWGCPIPVWRSKSGKIKVFGSIAELEKASGKKITDLHRPFIDEVVIHEDGEEYRRVEDVFDCWFESGSMPYAQVHYPFENKEWFEQHSPADFIVEYEAQTRGWFYSMFVLGVALFDRIPFKNCICHGVVLDEQGRKLSKRLLNYMDPKVLFEKYGSDSLRWFMMSSSIMRGSELLLDVDGKFIHDAIRLYIKPIWNAYYFFTLYANADGARAQFSTKSDNLMDRYILAKCAQMVRAVEQALDAYDTPAATQAISDFVEVLNNWYIRRNKDRFWGAQQSADKQAAYDTLYSVLHILCRVASPLLPMLTEKIYTGLTGEQSVHLADFPDVSGISAEVQLSADMDRVRDVCNTALSIRSEQNIRVRQPLTRLTCYGANSAQLADYAELIADEINVKHVGFSQQLSAVADHKLKLNNQLIGKRLPEKMKQIIPAAKQGQWELKQGELHVAGAVLLPEEYELNLEPKAGVNGASALSTNDALVVLDLTITAELEAEGKARDLVRLIQQARKDAGLQVSDRIALNLEVPPSAAAAVDAFSGYISEQTLAVSLTKGSGDSAAHRSEQQLDGEAVVIAFSVAA